MQIKFITLLLFLCVYNTYAQNLYNKTETSKSYALKKNGYTVKSVRKGDKSIGIYPNTNSEIIKVEIKNEQEKRTLNLKCTYQKWGEYIYNERHTDDLEITTLEKKQKMTINIIPDISDTTNMTLFVYFPYMTQFRYMKCDKHNSIKYIKYSNLEKMNTDTIPLLLIYEDKNNTEKNIVSKYKKDTYGYIDSKYNDDISKKIENSMLLYYTFK